jgi:hypothetical protein
MWNVRSTHGRAHVPQNDGEATLSRQMPEGACKTLDDVVFEQRLGALDSTAAKSLPSHSCQLSRGMIELQEDSRRHDDMIFVYISPLTSAPRRPHIRGSDLIRRPSESTGRRRMVHYTPVKSQCGS